MNLYRILRLAILLSLSSCVFGQSAPSPAGPSPQSQKNGISLSTLASGDQSGNVDILSDTRGVDFGPYLKQILKKVRENWYHLIPLCAETMKGKLAIEFAITKDGRLADMRLVSTAGETALDRAAWGGITASNPFPALPSEFTGPYLALRLRFAYNPDKSDSRNSEKKCDDYPTKVDSPKAQSGITVSIFAPDGVRVPIGGSRPISAVVTGTGAKENGVDWNVSGFGCSGAACGKMTESAYLSPNNLPDPPFVTLTAVSKADPTAKASVTLHIIDPSH